MRIKKSKSEETKQFIIEKAAPIFNMYGYAGTTMSQLTKAIGMTKGAIYGNFKNKDEIALATFDFNLSKIMQKMSLAISAKDNANDKLIAYASFSLNNFPELIKIGGCPVLSVATDSNFSHPLLKARVIQVIESILDFLANIMRTGIKAGEVNKNIDPEKYASILASLVEGGLLLSQSTENTIYLKRNAEHITSFVNSELRLTVK